MTSIIAKYLLGASLLLSSVAQVHAECDFELGKKVFNKCVACHSLEPGQHMMGPSLHGIFRRQVGAVEGFQYSMAMQQANFLWTDETMSGFLENPMQYLPGTTMPFGGLKKPKQREALACYLKSNGGE